MTGWGGWEGSVGLCVGRVLEKGGVVVLVCSVRGTWAARHVLAEQGQGDGLLQEALRAAAEALGESAGLAVDGGAGVVVHARVVVLLLVVGGVMVGSGSSESGGVHHGTYMYMRNPKSQRQETRTAPCHSHTSPRPRPRRRGAPRSFPRHHGPAPRA